MRANEVRKKFLDFFEKRKHKIVRSSSLIPADDPTLLFTNAGMVQFKRLFLGEESRKYIRAATSQKCVRAGGKHNDLENVGYTARHHTFFEMLGNFSFGDYFKEEAIEMAWELVTNHYGLPADKLWISIYKEDDESSEIWNKNIGVPTERIVRLGEKDNFWAMGDTGPCGPCSEIHIDRGEKFGCDNPDCKVGCDCDRYLEIWNLVFMQFDRDASGKMTHLPKPSIDTGMGLERMAAVVQNVESNYDTDLIMPIMKQVEELAEIKIRDFTASDVAIKVIADHSRATAFLIGDGVLPSNEGRGYVLRRIMRRAIRYGRNIGLMKPFLSKTTDSVFKIMKSAYPELAEAGTFITKVIDNEEIRFSETLDKGLKLLTDTIEDMKAAGKEKISGDIIFKLYDTYGFPVDIIRDVVRDTKISLDMETFNVNMDKQRESSKSKAVFKSAHEAYTRLASEGIKSEFTGYDSIKENSEILTIVKDGKEIESAKSGDKAEIVAKKTPFYGESGGQVGDKGKITNVDGLEIKIEDTIKDPAGIIIHKGVVTHGTINKNSTVTLTINKAFRLQTCASHTATHILHYALGKVLGDHVKQAGSMVSPDKLRFDFTHFSQVTGEQLEEIENIVNSRIRENLVVKTEEMDANKAFASGATALFEEKYGDIVRVVSIEPFSKELCGGTHINMTGGIGFFKITGETSIASGIRRIFALVGSEAVKHIQKTERILTETANMMSEKPENVATKVANILETQKKSEKENKKLKAALAAQSAEPVSEDFAEVNGVKLLAKKVEADDPKELRELADRFKDKIKSGIVILAGVAKETNKVMLIVAVTKDLLPRFNASEIVKEASKIVGGSGGGRPDMAQAGGTKPEKIEDVLCFATSGGLEALNK